MSTESQINAQDTKLWTLGKAIQFQKDYPPGSQLTGEQLREWMVKNKMIDAPAKTLKRSPEWKFFIDSANESRYAINRTARNVKFAAEGYICYEIQYLPKGQMYQVFKLFDDTRLLTAKFEEGLKSYISTQHKKVQIALNGAKKTDKTLTTAEITFLENIDKNLETFAGTADSVVNILKTMFQNSENQLAMAKDQGLITNGN